MRYRILPYKPGSRSAANLSNTIEGCRVLRLEGSRFIPRRDDVVINWGNSNPPTLCTMNGDRDVLARASNKLYFFRHQAEVNPEEIPPFWETPDTIPDEAFPIVCRTILNGHSGAGIHISADRAGLVPALLYVKYVKKQSEYRIHCGKRGDDFVIAEQKKVLRQDADRATTDFRVRNHQGGFVYQRQGIDVPMGVRGAALAVFTTSGLDFGAVDVIWNERQERAYVLEVNTAPGLEGQTVLDYANFFKGI